MAPHNRNQSVLYKELAFGLVTKVVGFWCMSQNPKRLKLRKEP